MMDRPGLAVPVGMLTRAMRWTKRIRRGTPWIPVADLDLLVGWAMGRPLSIQDGGTPGPTVSW